MKRSVLVVGDAAVDIIARITEYPPRGGNTWSEPLVMGLGGTAANVAAGIGHLGFPVRFIASIGSDLYGQTILQNMQQEGVDTSGVVQDPHHQTATVILLVDREGERTAIGSARASALYQLFPDAVREVDAGQTCALYISGLCLGHPPARDALLKAARLARAAGLPVYSDPNLRLEGKTFHPELREATLQLLHLSTTILMGNYELNQLYPQADPNSVIAGLLENGVEEVILKAGAKGCSGYSKAETIHLPACPVDVVDTTGAGDAFNAGYIVAHQEGLPVGEALRWGNATAAYKITRVGARSLPDRTQLLDFLAA